jgi:hypothetical protein
VKRRDHSGAVGLVLHVLGVEFVGGEAFLDPVGE